MFSKPFRIKSNTAIKGCDRRKLRANVAAAFPDLGRDQIPGRKELNIIRLCTHKEEIVIVYVSGRNPILFEVERNLYPTIYTLWAYPDLLPAFPTWRPLLKKLAGGADVMLPGLVVPPDGLPFVQQGDLCAITAVGSRAPIAIGVATMPTTEMMACGLTGKGFTVLHTYLDYLWRSGEKTCPPYIVPLDQIPPEVEVSSKLKRPVEGGHVLQGEETECHTPQREKEQALAEAPENWKEAGGGQDTVDRKTLQEQMDELLKKCFFHALKSLVTKADLPLLTSTFLGSHMFSCCPKGQQLDIKKSSYKKLSKFLQQMMNQEILQVKELSKGVDSIVDVDWAHPSIVSFIVPEPSLTAQKVTKKQTYFAPEIKSLYCVPATLVPLFKDSGLKKGSTLTRREVRVILMEYAKKNNLIDVDDKDLIMLNPTLSDCILEKEEQHIVVKLPKNKLLAKCLEKLQPAYKVTFVGQEPIVKKGKFYPIDITLVRRTFKKKVTLIRNLEIFGLDPYSVAAILQQRGKASATVSQIPGTKNAFQVQIQGNQISHLYWLLLEEYRIPRKYIHGLENSLNAYNY
ncbi:eukaryotic translation initiation factor 2D-like [Monodelphis domestica]|uniref:eukaryotic translation initiation factor 2D-like n=1 Tax=Monodelphis domestica TaxID=13616 RepID=UPI0000F2E973|nr:eukaryotic translation initiation factor 2D-like [Monodelphis domestica]